MREYSYDKLISRVKCSLDIPCVEDESYQGLYDLPDPDIIATEVVDDLHTALSQLKEIQGTFLSHNIGVNLEMVKQTGLVLNDISFIISSFICYVTTQVCR